MLQLAKIDLDHILAHTAGLWEELRDQHIFITGGTGFFGCWLLESFAYANDQLGLNSSAFVLTRNAKAFELKMPHLANYSAIHFLEGDIRTFNFPAGRFSYIIHAAVDSSVPPNLDYGLNFFDTTIAGTRRMLTFARYCEAKKFLLASSGAVYGKQSEDMTHISEEYLGAPDPLNVWSTYGESKRLAEHLCVHYAHSGDLQVKIARCFAFVGPHLPLDSHYAIGNFIRDGLAGGPIEIEGGESIYRSYLYAADLAIWLWTILFCGRMCRSYNVGSEEAISIADLALKVSSCFPSLVDVRTAKKTRDAGFVYTLAERYVPSTQRAREELGLEQRIGLEEAIKRTILWHGDQDV